MDDYVIVEKLCDDGYEVVKAKMPALVTVSSELGELRYTSFRSLQAVSKKPIQIFNAVDLELDLQKLTHRTIFNLVAFHGERQCRFIEGESSQEKGENLAIWMKKEGLI